MAQLSQYTALVLTVMIAPSVCYTCSIIIPSFNPWMEAQALFDLTKFNKKLPRNLERERENTHDKKCLNNHSLKSHSTQ